MPGPIDYYGLTSNIQIGDGLKSGYNEQIARQQAELQARQQAEERARVEAARARYDEALTAALKAPSAENYARLTLLNPKEHEGIQAAWGALDKDQQAIDLQDMSAVRGYLRAGKPEQAIASLKRRIDADKAAGQDTSDDEQVVALIGQDPEGAAGYVDYMLAGIMGPDKWSASFGVIDTGRREDVAQPSAIAKTVAETGKLKAETGQVLEETVQIAPNAEAEREFKAAQRQKWVDETAQAADRLGLDREKFQADADARLAELDIRQGALTPQATTAVNNAVLGAQGAQAAATKARELADAIRSDPRFSGGWSAGLAGALTGITGNSSAATNFRRQYTELRNSAAIKNLPPGVATEKDIQLVMAGLPPPNANRETLVTWLSAYERVNKDIAAQQDRQADWMAGNGGSLGPAKRGFFVGNSFVQPGTRFDDLAKEARKERAREAAAARVAK